MRGAEHVDGRLRQVAGPVGAGHHEGAGTVGDQAAVELVQRRRLERRGQHVVDGERVAVAGRRVHGRPLAGAHGDLGELLRRGAVGGHVATGRERVGPHRHAHAVGRLPRHHLVGPGAAAEVAGGGTVAVATRRGRVDAHHDLAEPGRDGRGGVLGVDLEARPAGHGGVGVARVDAEVLGEGHRRRGVAHAVDVGQRQPGVVEGLAHHLGLERPTPQVEHAGGRGGVGHAHDGRGAAQAPVPLTAHRPTPGGCGSPDAFPSSARGAGTASPRPAGAARASGVRPVRSTP